jgi:hypothetical protein
MDNLRSTIIVCTLFAVLLSAFGAERYRACHASGHACIEKRPLLGLLALPPLFAGSGDQWGR